MSMTSEEVRKSFLDFFISRGHELVAGSSLIPADPTTLFTSAGVQQFVPAFRGDVPVPHPRATSCQKCLRADDIDEVGDSTHETFFEMLGNFSIGDYFKKEAVEWGWEYSVKVLGLPPERIWISIYPTDEEAFAAWREMGVPEERIVRLPGNWWPATENWVGSTGACSEMFMDIGEEYGCGKPDCGPDCDCGRFVEYWNLVFPEFFQNGPGNRTRLERPGVDTGLGFERLVAILQGKTNIFECDLFAPIVEAIHHRALDLNPKYVPITSDKDNRAVRITADHSRAVAFALAEGILPSNEGRGYVIRKLLRRASYFGWKLAGALGGDGAQADGFERFVTPVVESVITKMAPIYPELEQHRTFILENVAAEEQRFESAILNGFPMLERSLSDVQGTLSGEAVFRFYDTYGIPKDLVKEIAAERGLEIDEAGFEAAMAEQRERSRAASAEKFAIQRTGVYQQFIGATTFVGYEGTTDEAQVIGIIRDSELLQEVSQGECEVILDRTPFYAEQGGQVGDRGRLDTDDMAAVVEDTVFAIDKVTIHRVTLQRGTLKVGDRVRAIVDIERRKAIARAHTATHLLHLALRTTLGPHALQHGSLVDADWLRFDFSHHEKLSQEQLDAITTQVNDLILQNEPVQPQAMTLEQARAMGAMALFGEKYGNEVRMVQIGDVSRELCGGTHLHSTAEVGLFLLASEGSVGAGLRRIEAYSGAGAVKRVQEEERLLTAASDALHAPEAELVGRIEALQAELKQAQRQIASLQQKRAGNLVDDLVSKEEKVGEVSLIAAQTPAIPQDALRTLADTLVEKLGSGVVVLAAEDEKSSPMVAKVSADLVARGIHAGKLVGAVAKLAGGGGGGRPDFAQAAAKDSSKIVDALAQAKTVLAEQLGTR